MTTEKLGSVQLRDGLKFFEFCTQSLLHELFCFIMLTSEKILCVFSLQPAIAEGKRYIQRLAIIWN